jgi:hypothetical protein
MISNELRNGLIGIWNDLRNFNKFGNFKLFVKHQLLVWLKVIFIHHIVPNQKCNYFNKTSHVRQTRIKTPSQPLTNPTTLKQVNAQNPITPRNAHRQSRTHPVPLPKNQPSRSTPITYQRKPSMTPKKSSKPKSLNDKKSPKPSNKETHNSPNSMKSTKRHSHKKSNKNSPKSSLKPSTKNSKPKNNSTNKNPKTTSTKPGTFFLTQVRRTQTPRTASQAQTR